MILYDRDGNPHEPSGVYRVTYQSELLDGILLDFPNNYVFLSEFEDTHADILEEIEECDEAQDFNLTDCDVDYDQKPHKWVVQSVGRLIIETAEELCKGATDGTT